MDLLFAVLPVMLFVLLFFFLLVVVVVGVVGVGVDCAIVVC